MMNGKRFISILTAALLLFTFLPFAAAETAGCIHDWAERWPEGKPANCLDNKPAEDYCTKCGYAERYTGRGDHQPGSWYWDGSVPACGEWGIQNRACALCGEAIDEREVQADHRFGEWQNSQNPTCVERGYEYRECTVCGEKDWRRTDTIDHAFGEWYVVQQPQLGVTGKEERKCSMCGLTEQRVIPALEGQQLDISSVLLTPPADGDYVAGETVSFEITYSCSGTLPATDARVHVLISQSGPDAADAISHDEVVASHEELAPNTDYHASFHYTVTEQDAQNGFFLHYAYITDAQGQIAYSGTIPLYCKVQNPELNISSALLTPPADGDYVAGETVAFDITYSFTGAPALKDARVHALISQSGPDAADAISHDEVVASHEELAPNTDYHASFHYTVTEQDAQNGFFLHYAYITDAQGQIAYSGTIPLYCKVTVDDSLFDVVTHLEITKQVENTPLNGAFFTEGETIHYAITFVNAGDTLMTDVTIYDALSGLDELASAEKLEPGESRACRFSHTVTEADVQKGYVINIAVASYRTSESSWSAYSNTVMTDTDGLPDAPAEDPGHADLPALRSGSDSCVRAITSRDNASASYETAFCSVHAPVQSSVLAMRQAAATKELRKQAADYAVMLWRAEAEKLYQALLETCDSQAKAIVTTEYVRFAAVMGNREAALRALYPENPELVAETMADLWEEKCITLCMELHADAATRKDGLTDIAAGTGAAFEVCSLTTDAQNGRKTCTQAFCPMHSFPFSMTDTLLGGQDTAEAWNRLQMIWRLELDKAYSKLGAQFAPAAANQAVLLQWLTAREAQLMLLYPQDPALAASILTKTIVDHVNALCQIVP